MTEIIFFLDNLDYDKLSSSENITWEMVRNNLHRPWNFKTLSFNKVITWDNIQDTPFLKWDWSSVTLNVNITLDIIKNNIQCPWDFEILQDILSNNDFESLTQCKNNNNNLDR